MTSLSLNSFTLNFQGLEIFLKDKKITSTEESYEDSNIKVKFSLDDNRILGSANTAKSLYIDNIAISFKITCVNKVYFYKNGFQSWSPSEELSLPDKQTNPIFPPLKKHFLDPESYIKVPTGSSLSHFFTYLRCGENKLYFIPKDNQKTSTHFTYNFQKKELRIIIEVGKEVIGKTNLLELNLLTDWLNWKNITSLDRLFTWCSWYYYYNKIDEKIILDNLKKTSKLPFKLNYFQIDDGWQESIGDWKENKKFPSGLKEIASQVKDAGIKPGIWIAPFVVEKKSLIFQEKKDWLLKNERGKLITAGFNPLWSGFFYTLDITHPEVKAYLTEKFDYLKKCGFNLFKCDFLYSLLVKGNHYQKNLSRNEILHMGISSLREMVGKEILLGCGAPLLLSPKTYDILRIGTDTSNKWVDFLGVLLHYEAMPSAYNALHNTLTRQFLDGAYFLNDPDVAYLRKTNLTRHQNRTIIINNYLLSQYFSFSDPIDLIEQEYLDLLQELQAYKDFKVEKSTVSDNIFYFEGKTTSENIFIWVNFSFEPAIVDLPANLIPILHTERIGAFKPYETKVFKKA
ncbi:MAG: Alpha-galactosidase [candidate division WS2 bacterium]|nr:Alpha-galactosidase [Candidatus Lithacetigena glycinireducens]